MLESDVLLINHKTFNQGFINNPKMFLEHINSRILSNNDYLYSTMIRKMRLNKGLTISEVSESVCSISYLSKLENGSIVSNDYFLRGLFEKLDVNIDDFRKQNLDNNVKEQLKAYFYNDVNKLAELNNNTYDTPLNIYVSLIRALFYLYNNEYQKVEDELKNIEPIKDTFGKYEATVYFFIVVEFYIKTFNFDIAYEYLSFINLIDIDDPILKSLLYESIIKVSVNIKNYIMLYTYYNKYNESLFSGYPIGRLIKIRLYYNLALIRELPDMVLDDINTIDINNVPKIDQLDILYLKTLIRLNYCNYEEMFKEVINQEEYLKDARFIGVLAYLAYCINKSTYFHKLLKITENYQFLDKDYIHHKFIFFVLLYASNASDDDVVLFIRKEINGKLENEYFDMYNHIYRKVYLGILTDQSRYKEAFCYLNAKLFKNEREEKRRVRSLIIKDA